MLKGSNDAGKTNYSTVTVGSDITLEGWSGIFINHNNKTAYGVLVNMKGTIKAVDDINGGPGTGIYINGNIKNQDNCPIINLSNTTKINSTGNGIYAAGFAIYNINGAYIEGKQSGLGIKSGIFNIKDGTILGTGPDKTPTNGNNNGINSSGTAIQIESNSGYKGDIELYIKNGNIESKNSNVIYEYTINNTSTKVKNIDLTGGTYKSHKDKDIFLLSDNFKKTHKKFISGGSFSSNPSQYLINGYNTTLNNSMYNVTANTMLVFAQKTANNTSNILIFIIISTIIISIFLILNQKKILNLLNSL